MQVQKLGFIRELDTFRFLAVVLVVISHWAPHSIVNRSPNGYLGVTFFFVLSGFLISYNLLVNKQQIDSEKLTQGKALARFYWRRTLRIFPLYYLVIVLLYILNKNIFDGNVTWYITYASNILFFKEQEWPGMLSHFWSLAVEEQFYLIWPFLVLFIPGRYLLWLFLITILVSVSYKLIMALCFPNLFYPDLLPIGAFDAFGIGAILAWQLVYGRSFKILESRNLLWALPLLVVALVLHIYGYGLWMMVYPFVAVLIIHRTLQGFSGIGSFVFGNPVTVYLGKISYGLYVYHNFMPWLLRCLRGVEVTYPISVKPFLAGWNPSTPLSLLFQFCLLITIASVSWFCFEKPFNNLKKYF